MKALQSFVFLALSVASLLAASRNSQVTEPVVIVQNGKYGYIDHNGEMVIRPQFLWARDFVDGLGAVYVCGRMVSINADGKLLPWQASPKGAALRPKKVGGKYGFANASGQLRVDARFDDVLPYSDGFAAVSVQDKWGFIDGNGRIAVAPSFDMAGYFHEGVAYAVSNDVPVIINKQGNALARGYEQLSGIVAEGRIPVSRGSKYGYLNLRGAVAIPLIYDGGDSFSEGLAPVKRGDKWGYVDTDGAVAIPFLFDAAEVFGNGLAPVRTGDQSGFIDKSGNFVFRLSFQYAPGFWQLDGDIDVSRFWTKEGGFGYVNSSGKVIWGPTMESPDHAPLLGWSDQDKTQSCIGVPENLRKEIASFPESDE